MKKSELVFSAILVPVDYFMVIVGGWLAYQMRFLTLFTEIRPIVSVIDYSQYQTFILLVPLVFLAVFALSGLYAIKITRRLITEMTSIIIACTAAVAFVIIVIFFQRELFSSRFIVLIGWVLIILLVMLGRLLVRIVQRAILKRGIGVHNIVVIGQDKTTEDIVKQIYKFPILGYRIIGRFNNFSPEAQQEIKNKLNGDLVDEIIQADITLAKSEAIAVKDFCYDHHLVFRYATDLFDVQPNHIEVSTIADIPVIEVKRTKLDGWGRIFKRAFDILISFACLLILSPFFAITALAIVIDSQGGVFVRLERVGERGKHFRLYKFRSMVKNAEALKKDLLDKNERTDGPLFKIKNDPRVTRIGRITRKTSIDELPQLINVLMGQMSLIGPRPHEPEEVAKYERWHNKLLTIKPGVTGLAQISGRSDLKFEDEAKLDIFYIENWSPELDLQILLKTPLVVIWGKTAS